MKPFSQSLLLGGLFLSSCVGAGVVRQKERVHTAFSIVGDSRIMRSVHPSKGANPSKKTIQSIWGTPDRVRTQQTDTIWSYNTRAAFSGAVPMVGIGVPLVLPTGYDSIDLYFRDSSDVSYRAIEHYTSWSGAYLGHKDHVEGAVGFNKLQD